MLYFTNIKGQKVKVNHWEEFNEPIVNMMFQINEKEMIVLEGFEAYLRIMEEIKGVMVSFQGTSKILLYGKYMENVAEITLDLIKGKVTQQIKPFNKAYQNKPLNPKLWKKGILSTPKIYRKEID